MASTHTRPCLRAYHDAAEPVIAPARAGIANPLKSVIPRSVHHASRMNACDVRGRAISAATNPSAQSTNMIGTAFGLVRIARHVSMRLPSHRPGRDAAHRVL